MSHADSLVSCDQALISSLFSLSVERPERDSLERGKREKISEGSTGKTFLLPTPQCLLGHSAKDIYMISYTQKFENHCPGGKLKYDYQGR